MKILYSNVHSVLFNVYFKAIVKEVLTADDYRIIVYIFGNIEDLQRMMQKVANVSRIFGLCMKIKKTKCVVIAKSKVNSIILRIDSRSVASVKSENGATLRILSLAIWFRKLDP